MLTDEEIANADCVIVAADAKVPMDRFDGKKLIEVPVSDGISKADQLVERAISGEHQSITVVMQAARALLPRKLPAELVTDYMYIW